ncbi:glycosyltransferase family 2 protein [Herbaspirillum sp. NPDC087042]|uniref:glycosyltransferase family 2 protein n=1 Tax=Herbaspirillum sp. NPDC087042 TaxID=3364004 RepID=UPI00381754E9
MSEPTPLRISVITVCYNSAATLGAALQSVADQSWPHIEHIVIDGASTDGTLEIIEQFRPHLAKVVSERDHGIYDAMNKGLALASGDIICFLNADDHYAWNGALADVAQQMQEHRLEALLGDVAFFHAGEPARTVRRYRSNRFHPDRLAWGWQPAHPALFLRRNVIERVGQFKTSYRIAGDFEFIVRAFHGANLRYRHLPKVYVRMQTGGASTDGLKSKIRLNREVLRACRENGLRTNMLKILSKYPLKLLELVSH